MKLQPARVGLRLARRELRARPARAALVVLLVVVPTAAMTVATTLFRTSELSWHDVRAAHYGAAASRAYFSGPVGDDARFVADVTPTDADIEALRQSVPAGTPFMVERNAIDRYRGPDSAEQFSLLNVDLTHPLARGKYTLLEGRAPRTRDEAVAGRELAEALDLRIGSTLRPERLAITTRIVGIMKTSDDYGLLLVTPEPFQLRGTSTNVYLGSTPTRPRVPGWTIEYGNPFHISRTDSVLWTYVGGAIGMFALGTIVAAAFALGARRQLRTIGLLSASGAPPRTVAWALTAQGALAGAVGSLTGIALGVIAMRLLPLRLLQSLTTRQVSAPETRVADLVPIAVIGVLAAVGAAAFPARAAARLAVLQALASRRPDQSRRGTWLVALAALVTSAAVIAWTVRFADVGQSNPARLAVVLASVLPFVSALLAAPLVVGRLERWVRSAPLAWRLAGRSLARNRARSASVVGATCAVVGIAIAGATLSHSWSATPAGSSTVASAIYRRVYLQPNQVLVYSQPSVQPDHTGAIPDAVYQPRPADPGVLARVRGVLPAARQVDLVDLRDADGRAPHYRLDSYDAGANFGPTPLLTVATPELLDLFDAGAAARRRLAAGEVVVVRSPGVRRTPLDAVDRSSGATILRVGATIESPAAALALPRVLIGAARARELGWQAVPSGVTAFVAAERFTPAERTQLQLVGMDLQWEQIIAAPPPPGSVFHPTYVEVGAVPSRGITAFQVRLLAFGLAALLVLGVVGVGLGLAARDSQDETAVLDAVGAHPRMRRQIGTRRAVLLVVTACAIALPAGIVPVAAMISASTSTDLQFRIDWFALGALALLLPLVVGLTSASGGWLRDRLRSRPPNAVPASDW